MIMDWGDNVLIVVFCAVAVTLNVIRVRRHGGSIYRSLWIVGGVAALYELIIQVVYLLQGAPPMLIFSTGTAALAFSVMLNAIVGRGQHD